MTLALAGAFLATAFTGFLAAVFLRGLSFLVALAGAFAVVFRAGVFVFALAVEDLAAGLATDLAGLAAEGRGAGFLATDFAALDSFFAETG